MVTQRLMKAFPHLSRRRRGYTLIEILAAAGLISAAVGAAAALSVTISSQEEFTRGQIAAQRYAEAIAKLWQIGVDPGLLLFQPQGVSGSNTYNPMSYTLTTPTSLSLGDDGGIPQGTVQKTTITVTWRPYGSSANNTLVIDALRPADGHR
jgi:type II secretory pathway pseudopilin PulG